MLFLFETKPVPKVSQVYQNHFSCNPFSDSGIRDIPGTPWPTTPWRTLSLKSTPSSFLSTPVHLDRAFFCFWKENSASLKKTKKPTPPRQKTPTEPSLKSTGKMLWKIGQTQTAVNYSWLSELCRWMLYNMIVLIYATMEYFPHLHFKMIRFCFGGVPTCLKVGRGAIIFFMQLLDMEKQWAGTEIKQC